MTTTRLLWTLGVLFVIWTVGILLGLTPGPFELVLFFLLGVAAIGWWEWGRSRNGASTGES